MWCDSFDADLPRVVPGALEVLGAAAGIELRTYSRVTDGKINHPACWNTHEGTVAFFWTSEEFRPGAYWVTDAPEAGCTFWEAVRDEWVHGCAITINEQLVWRPPQRLMTRLMYDVRGQIPLKYFDRAAIRAEILLSLGAAADRAKEAVRRAPG